MVNIDSVMLENIILGLLIFILFIVGSWVGFLFYRKKRWPYEYELYENVSGLGYRRTKKGRCRLITITQDGLELFYLKDDKKFRPAFGKRMGVNLIWWAKNRDGYWRNITLEDIDDKLLKIGVNVIDAEMRSVHAANRKLIADNFKPGNWMEKYGVYIAFGMLFLCIIAMGVSIYYGLNQIKDINAQTISNQEAIRKSEQETLAQVNIIISKLEVLKQTGSIISSG